jgi:Beta-lactamase enzyme family
MRRLATAGMPVALTVAVLALPASAGADGPAAPAGSAANTPALDRWEPGVEHAKRYAKRRTGDIRFAVIDPDGRLQHFHGGRTAPAASVFKAMLLATYLRQSSVRDRRLRAEDKRLLRPMIVRSDNETATRVRDIVGKRAIERLARHAGMRHFKYSSTWGLSRTAPTDQARFFHTYDRHVPARHERYARRLLASIVSWQRWGIAQARPDGWKLYFKGGWGVGSGRVNHQVAFLERRGERVSLAIFTEYSRSHGYGTRTIEGVAKRLLKGLPRFGRPPGAQPAPGTT